MIATVPAPRSPGRYRIGMVCLGNICRSPTADVVLNARVAEVGLTDVIEVVSAGTGDWHVGEPMDRRSAELLTSEGYDARRHRAQQVPAAWLTDLDLVLAMDRQNLADLRELSPAAAPDPQRVRLFRDFDPEEPGADVPDPWHGGPDGFREVLTMVERTCASLLGLVAGVVGDR